MKTTEQNAEVGVIVARFQSPYLHEGHIDILTQVTNLHPRVIILLGNSPVRCSKNNPLDFQARKAMIEATFPNVEIYYVDDVGSNALWSKNLDLLIRKSIGPSQKAVLYGSRDSFISAYSGKFPTIELVPTKFISAREIRKNVGIKSKNTQEFREGVTWAVENQYPKVYPTVDMAVICFDTKRLLLARKPSEELFRFAGGFADVKSESYEADAIRETDEEMHVTVSPDLIYVGSISPDDWRYRSEQDKIRTSLYILKYIGGTPRPDDDIAEVKWVYLSDVKEEDIVSTHRPLIKLLKNFLSNLDSKIEMLQELKKLASKA